MSGWRSLDLAFSTIPINLDLDIRPTRSYELMQHPTKPTQITIHRPNGTTIYNIENRRLDKLHEIYQKSIDTNPEFAESLAKIIKKTINNTI
jgi:hypothetical protein